MIYYTYYSGLVVILRPNMKSIQNTAAGLLILAVGVLSVVSIFGVWDIFARDVITKSFQTIGLLAMVAVIIMVAGRFIESRQQAGGQMVPAMPSPAFRSIRSVTLTILIISVALLAFLGILAIWEVVQDRDILYKSLSSLGILAFGAFLMTMICLERENKFQKEGSGLSIGGVVGFAIVAYMLFALMAAFGFWR